MTPTVTPTAPAAFTPVAPAAPPTAPVAPAPATASPITPPAAGWIRLRWTLDQYRRLDEKHFGDVRTVLIDGEIYIVPRANPPHDVALSLTDEYLRSICPPGHYVRNQQAFNVQPGSGPEPDLAVVHGSTRTYATAPPTTAVLVVEVSDSTLFEDTTLKAEEYATAGVPDYWVVDVKNRKLLVYRKPAPLPEGLGATAYRSHEEYGPDDSVAPLAAPDRPVKVADLLP